MLGNQGWWFVPAVALLLLAAPTTAWHLPDEEENIQFGSRAGDPRTLDDAAACLAAADAAHGDDISCVALYAHEYDLLNPIPLNTQRPADCVEDMAQGFTGTPGIEPFWAFSRAVAYSTPGFVEYDVTRCQERPRVHTERGLADSLHVSSDVDIVGHWHLSADVLEFSPLGLNTPDGTDTGAHTGVMPCVTVRMELQLGRFPGGAVIAEGQTTKTLVTTPKDVELPALPLDPCPDSEGLIQPETVTEFTVNLGRAGTGIPAHQGFLLVVLWYQHDGGKPDEMNNIIQREWNRHTGPEYANRVVLPLVDPVRVDALRVHERDEGLAIKASVLAALGSYDVDTANSHLVLFDEHGHEIPLHHLEGPVLRYSVDHDGHHRPVEFHYLWDQESEALEPGAYTLRFTAPSWQHSAQASESITILIGPHEDRGGGVAEMVAAVRAAPAAPAAVFLAVALLALVALAAGARPRR